MSLALLDTSAQQLQSGHKSPLVLTPSSHAFLHAQRRIDEVDEVAHESVGETQRAQQAQGFNVQQDAGMCSSFYWCTA